MKLSAHTLCLSLLLFAGAGAPWGAAASGPEYVDCKTWAGWHSEENVRCGYLAMPEDHDNPAGRSIEIAFAIFRGANDSDKSVATLLLTGGPGGRSLASASLGLNHETRALGDLIVVEQRGIGLSSPLPALGEEFIEIIASDADTAEELVLSRALMTQTAAAIKATGTDLGKYNSTQNAMDFGLIMEELGYEKYNLYGVSYGTKLAMMIMKFFSPRIRAAILEGPAILNNTALESRFPDLLRALDLLFEKCALDARCRAAHPDLRAEMLQAVGSLRERPMTITLLQKDFVLNSQDLLFFIRYLLYRDTAFETAPRFIKAVNDRDSDTLSELGEFPARLLRGANLAVFFSFNLYEEYSPHTPTAVSRFIAKNEPLSGGLAWFQAFIPALHLWHDERVSEDEARLENIAVPALIITNDFDPVTPPHNTRLFEAALNHEQILRLNRFGHGSGGRCISRIRISFLKNPDAPIDTACLQR